MERRYTTEDVEEMKKKKNQSAVILTGIHQSTQV